MPRNLSLWLLLGLLAAIGLLFFHVIKPFVVALFIAVVLAVLFSPLHRWITRRIRGHDRIAALMTTVLVVLLVLLPIGVTLLMAGSQAMEVGRSTVQWLEERTVDETKFRETIGELEQTQLGRTLTNLHHRLPTQQRVQLREAATRIADGITVGLYNKTRGMLSDVFTFVIGFCIMSLGLYYFLADRKLFVGEVHRMMPLANDEEKQLTDRFQQVCRGVVLGSVMAGLMQATLAGIAFAVLGVSQVWVLIVLTMFFSFIPFVGSTVIWGSVAIGLMIEGRFAAGLGLVIYGGALIATSDNLVRAYVIGNQARLHPLVALVTVLGALNLIGLWGIFVGPMIAAFLYALLNIARERINGTSNDRAVVLLKSPTQQEGS